MLTAEAIKARAADLGFELCGIARAVAWPELGHLRAWLDRGYGGEMQYLDRTAVRRMDPRAVLPSARSAIVAGTVYNVDRPYSTEQSDRSAALVSRYAWGEDYHPVTAVRLEALLSWMRAASDEPFEARAYVDTGPIQEKVFAQYAGIGWIGKNTCVINPDMGSWFFLSVILCSLDLECDEPALDQCGTCTLCLEACPTGAIVGPRLLDATRCISYLTIEMKGTIPAPLRPGMENRIFGCDVCQDVCPYNSTAARSGDLAWQPRPGLDHPRLIDLWRRSDRALADLVAGTPLTRPKLNGLRRNIAVAMGNSGDLSVRSELAAAAPAAAADDAPSRYDPVVREHAAWAAVDTGTKGLI